MIDQMPKLNKQSLPTSNQKGIAHLFLILLILAGIGVGLYLVQNPTIFNPKADNQIPNNTIYTMNVLVLNYFPLDSSGQNLDSSITGVSKSLIETRSYVENLTNQGISQMTNGTKFRGYKDPSQVPSITYIVAATKEYLEALPVSTNKAWNNPTFRPDYQKVLTKENICDWVDNKGVKQVWLWGYHYGNIEPDESNMSMGNNSKSFWNFSSYGDISNSQRINDMPICNKTYTLYNYNYGRGLGELLEDHGHQIESVYRFVDNILWDKFQKPNGDTNPSIVNHCGWTHSPPNSGDWQGDRGQYDWNDKTIVKSDCEDWKPDGGGAFKEVNCNTWYEPFYQKSYTNSECQQDMGVSFKIWWMQNIPGRGNTLTYQGKPLRNWWDFYGDFDGSLASGKMLTQPVVPSPSLSPSPSNTDVDNDGFTDSLEAFMGTNPNRACPLNTSDNAWPVDTNNDRGINGSDVSLLVPYIGEGKDYDKRYDLNQDGSITEAGDIPVIQANFGKTCTPISGAGYSFSYNSSSVFGVGEEFLLNVLANTNGQPANTFHANMNFDPTKLEVKQVTINASTNSFLTQVDDTYYDNSTGEISLIGGLPTPGISNFAPGTVMAQVIFKVKAQGQTTLKFNDNSQIISDTTNSNILTKSEPLTLNLGQTVPVPSASIAPSPSPSPSPILSPSPPSSACALKSAVWVTNINPVVKGTPINIRITGEGQCAGKKVNIVVKEDDGLLTEDVLVNPQIATFLPLNVAVSAWIAEFQQDGFNGWSNPPEYYFTASLADNPQISVTSSKTEELKVNNTRQGEFLNGDGNKDGKIDILDLSVLRKWWNKTGFPQEIDINDDGVINTPDISGLRKILEIAGIIKTKSGN